MISSLKLNGFKEVFFGSGTSKETLSPTLIFFEGKLLIFPLIFNKDFQIHI